MASVVIDIATEFTGKKAFKQAETATDKLTKGVKSLGLAFGAALSARAVIQYGRASVKAFSADEAAATRLSQAVTNLGLGFENLRISTFIGDLEKSANVADDLLRPAFQALLTTTRDAAKSQDLLNLALDISAGSGQALTTVANDLSRAYVGNTRGLLKYNLGLTKAQLGTKSFAELQGLLNDQFSGSNAARLGTYQGKIEALNISLGNAQETIGKGLVDSFIILAGDKGIGAVTSAIDDMAFSISAAIVETSLLVDELRKIPLVSGLMDILKNPLGLPQGALAFGKGGLFDQITSEAKLQQQRINYNQNEHRAKQAQIKSTKTVITLTAAQLAAQKKLLATQKQIAAEKKKTEALDKASLLLAQGKKLFDEEGIQLAAAAQGKLTEEERTRLALKKDIYDLEAAINEGNVTAAAKLANSMVSNAQKLSALRGDMIGLNDIQNPFDAWLKTLQQMAYELSQLAMIKPVTSAAAFFTPEQQAKADELTRLKERIQKKIDGQNMDKLLPAGSLPSSNAGTFAEGPDAARFYNQTSTGSGASSVVVNIAGSVTTERDLVAAITQGLYSQQASGIPVLYSTVY
jgi:hypothetical protein